MGKRAAWIIVAVVVASGCPPQFPPPPGPTPPPFDPPCSSDRDCASDARCDKDNDGDGIPAADDASGFCFIFDLCFDDSACQLGQLCNPARGICERNDATCSPLDNALDEAGVCAAVEGFCLVTDGVGRCAQEQVVAARCEVVLQRPVAHDGELIEVGLFAFDANDRFISAAQPGAVRAQCDGDRCLQQVGFNPPGTSCAATLRVLAPRAGGGQRVVVVDDAGVFLRGTAVRALRRGVVQDAVTDDEGVAVFDVVGGVEGVDVLSILPVEHEQHTIVAPPSDLIVVTRRESRAVSGAVVFTDFSDLHTLGELKVGVSGLPLSRDLGRFSLDALLGPPVDVVVDIAGITNGPQVAPLPRGMILGLGDNIFRGEAIIAAPAPPPASGRLFVWNLSTQLRLSVVGPLLGVEGGLDRDLALGLLTLAGPQSDHGLALLPARDAVLLEDAADDDGNGLPDAPPSAAGLAEVRIAPDTLAYLSSAQAPPEPQQLTLVVVDVPGAGLVPLGLQERSDVSAYDDGLDDGVIAYAPPHDGLEGFAVKTVVIAYEARPWRDVDDVRVRIGAGFAPSATASFDGDRVTFAALPDGVDVVHLRLTTAAGRRWNLWSQARTATAVDAAVVAPDVAVAMPQGFSAVLESVALLAGTSFSLTDAGGLADVVALTRVGCVDDVCAP